MRLAINKNVLEAAENPVLTREFRSRMRGGRNHLVTGAYALMVAVFVLITYWGIIANSQGQPTNLLGSELGRGIWTWGCIAQSLLLPLIVPAFTLGAITTEREREMLDLLLLTRQSSLKICLGKWASGVGLGLMLVLSSIPILSLSNFLGGVEVREMAISLLVLAIAAASLGAFGLVVSTFARRTVNATVIGFIGVGFLMLGVPFCSSVLGMYGGTVSETTVALHGITIGLLSAPPAAALLGLVYLASPRIFRGEVTRVMWIVIAAACWVASLLVVQPFAGSDLATKEQVLFMLHPTAVAATVFSPPSPATTHLHPWIVFSLFHLAAVLFCLCIAVVRTHRMREAG